MIARLLSAALVLGLVVSSSADAGILGRLLNLVRGGSKVVAVAKPSITRELGILGDDVLRGMSAIERSKLDSAVSRFIAHPDGKTIAQKVEELRVITAVDVGSARSIPYSEQLQNLWIRVPESTAYDAAARRFATIRMEQSLASRFDARDIRVVTTALADDASISAKQTEKFRKAIPNEILDSSGPLGRSEVLGTTEYGQMLRALQLYKGKTLVIVGHMSPDSASFFMHTKEGIRQIAIAEWSRAAREVQVNLLAIGCNSGRTVEFGATGLVNSAEIGKILHETFAQSPTTVRDFLRAVTGPNLSLVVSPAKAGYFSNEAEIVSRLTRERIGRVFMQEGREGIRSIASSNLGRSTEPICFEGSPVGACTSAVKPELSRDSRTESQEEDPASDFAEIEHEDRIDHLNSMRRRLLATGVYTFVWLATAYLIPLGFVACWTANEEESDSLGLVRRPDVRRATFRLIGRGLIRPISTFRGERIASIVIAPIVLGPLVYFAHGSISILAILIMIGSGGLWIAIAIFPTSSSTKEADSLIIPALAFVLWALAGTYLYFEASHEVEMREQLSVSTYLSSQAGAESAEGADHR